MHIRVKICGITRPEDGLAAARLGVDAIGLVFYDPSPRAVTLAQARDIVAALPPFMTTVALFVDPEPQAVEAVLNVVKVDLLQFHGDESPSFCASFARPFIKAIRMHDGIKLDEMAERYSEAQGLLLDTYVDGVAGGTGQAFDWKKAPRDFSQPIILAGGLNPNNVAEAITTAHPYAVDVSGGVEAEKGIKDAAKMAALMGAVRRVNNE